MPEYTVQMNRLHPKQAEIVNSPFRFRVLACGRRFGKTEQAVYEMCHRALRGEKCAYFAPNYKMTQETWRQVFWRMKPVIAHSSKTEGRMEFITGGTVEFWSLSTTSAETVRGRKYHFAVIDEAAMVVNLEGVWEEVIRPLLVDYRGGALFCSTPKGRNGFWQFFQFGIDPAKKEWQAWNFPTTANPYINAEEVEQARITTVERRFRQEYLAEFVEDAGSVFRGVPAVSVLQPASARPQAHRLSMGIDWGRDIDFTTISVIDATTNQQLYLDRFNQVSWSLQRGRVMQAYEQWKPDVVFAEANSMGGPVIEALQAEGLPIQPFTTSAASKPPLIEGLALAIERQEVYLLDDPVQKHELMSYEMTRTPSGHYVYGAPPGGHDDTVIGTALAWHGAAQGEAVLFAQYRFNM